MRIWVALGLLALERVSRARKNPYRRFRAGDPGLERLVGGYHAPPRETYEYHHHWYHGDLDLQETHLYYVRHPKDVENVVGVFSAPVYSGTIQKYNSYDEPVAGTARKLTIVPELYMYSSELDDDAPGVGAGPSLIRGAVRVLAKLPDDCIVQATLNDDSEGLAEILAPDDIIETYRFAVLNTSMGRLRKRAKALAAGSRLHKRLLAPLLEPYSPPDPDPMVHIWIEDLP